MTTTARSTQLHHVEHVMGTAVSFDIRDHDDQRRGLDAAIAWLHHVDRTFSPYIPDSPISRFGRGDVAVEELDEEITGVLLECEMLRADTDGAFDAFAVPAPNGTRLDPSGFVKGWSIERAAVILEGHGHTDFAINAGGDITVRGHAAPDTPWSIGVRHPDDPNRLAMVLEAVGPAAVATSATYERGAHIVDPRTGRPTTELASVTVVGPDLTTVDAFATAIFVMGLDGLRWLAKHPGHEAMAITHDDRVHLTPGFDRWRRRPSEPHVDQ